MLCHLIEDGGLTVPPEPYNVLYVGRAEALLMMSSVMSLLMPVRDGGIFCAYHGFHERMDLSSMIDCFWWVSLYCLDDSRGSLRF